MYFIGGDIHKDISTFNVMNDKFKTIDEYIDVPTTEEGFLCITRNYHPDDCVILIESSTRSIYVQRFFCHAGYNIIVGHAKDLSKISDTRAKTDRIDARKLAEYAKSYYEWDKYRPTDDVGRPVRPPFRTSRMTDISEYKTRNLSRQMIRLTHLNSGYKKSIREYMSAQNILMPMNYRNIDAKRSIRYLRGVPDEALLSMVDVMERTSEWEKDIEEELREMIGGHEDVRLLMTIPGIDFKLATYFAMHIRDVTDFETPDALACYFGLVPKVKSSAEKPSRNQPIIRDSNSKLRKAVYDAVRTHVRTCRNSDISRFHLRMMYKIGIRKAEAAAGRKLVTVMWAMLTYREPFSPHPRR